MITLEFLLKLFKLFKTKSVDSHKILSLNLPWNDRNNGQRWRSRRKAIINRCIVHQAMGNLTTQQVHAYHISTKSHLKLGVGSPKISYHFSIERDGTIYKVNDLTDITWHCKGQNAVSVGIVVLGDFDGPSYIGKGPAPSIEQLSALEFLLQYLISELNISKSSIFGHAHFGNINCPGIALTKWIEDFKSSVVRI